MDFYDEVLRELLVAMGAALFVGNLLALLRRRTVTTSADIGPEENGAEENGAELERAPVGRTVAFMVLGFVVALWGLASLLAS